MYLKNVCIPKSTLYFQILQELCIRIMVIILQLSIFAVIPQWGITAYTFFQGTCRNFQSHT